MGFLYTLVVRRPFESLITDVSRKGMPLSFSVSMVKRIVGCWLLRCCKKPSTWSGGDVAFIVVVTWNLAHISCKPCVCSKSCLVFFLVLSSHSFFIFFFFEQEPCQVKEVLPCIL